MVVFLDYKNKHKHTFLCFCPIKMLTEKCVVMTLIGFDQQHYIILLPIFWIDSCLIVNCDVLYYGCMTFYSIYR